MGILDLFLGTDGGDLKVGDWVEIIEYGQEGEIIEIQGDSYFVEIDDTGQVEDFKANELRKI